MASKAVKLLESLKTSSKKKVETRLVIEPATPVVVASFDREAPVSAVARYFRILSKRCKSLESELATVKEVLRRVGTEGLESAFAQGEYYDTADVGGATVSRANKYGELAVDRDTLKEVVGESYGAMFTEEAVLRFKSADALKQHLNMCKIAGVTVEGEESVSVKGKPGLGKQLCAMWADLSEEKREVLKACAKDQAARVGVK